MMNGKAYPARMSSSPVVSLNSLFSPCALPSSVCRYEFYKKYSDVTPGCLVIWNPLK
jgi:hypothetical protein